jgi:hypothetical protein
VNEQMFVIVVAVTKSPVPTPSRQSCPNEHAGKPRPTPNRRPQSFMIDGVVASGRCPHRAFFLGRGASPPNVTTGSLRLHLGLPLPPLRSPTSVVTTLRMHSGACVSRAAPRHVAAIPWNPLSHRRCAINNQPCGPKGMNTTWATSRADCIHQHPSNFSICPAFTPTMGGPDLVGPIRLYAVATSHHTTPNSQQRQLSADLRTPSKQPRLQIRQWCHRKRLSLVCSHVSSKSR